jgi:hypothetical protein
MTRLKILCAALAALGFAAPAMAAEACLRFESAVTISGKLTAHAATSPDPYFTLILDKPICVDQAPGDDLGQPASGVQEIQLRYATAGEKPRQTWIDQAVTVKGHLHPREKEGDRTAVIMRVESLAKR